ncbi:hypothetical protein GC176_23600 [bacterium]|nr:hypothetical protein [bacterium]
MEPEAVRVESFEQLAASRRTWISDVLVPWCRQARMRDLREAEFDWPNIAGRVDPAMTLYTWAWSRFPALIHESLSGLNETLEVSVKLRSGETVTGYPDARESSRGELVLTVATEAGFDLLGPYSIDDVISVEPAEEVAAPLSAGLPPRVPTTLLPGTPDDQRV